MGRVQIAKMNGGSLNPPYTYSTSPTLRYKTQLEVINNIKFPANPYTYATYWSVGVDNDVNIDYNDVNNIEIQCKFFPMNGPSKLEELFSLVSIFTPDMTTSGYISFWDNSTSQYWLEYPITTYYQWYYLKLNYDKATYTQTWSISTDGINFTTIGTHSENRNSEIEANWNNTNGSNLNGFYLGCIGINTDFDQDRGYSQGYIDLNETYMKINGNIVCRGIIQGS